MNKVELIAATVAELMQLIQAAKPGAKKLWENAHDVAFRSVKTSLSKAGVTVNSVLAQTLDGCVQSSVASVCLLLITESWLGEFPDSQEQQEQLKTAIIGLCLPLFVRAVIKAKIASVTDESTKVFPHVEDIFMDYHNQLLQENDLTLALLELHKDRVLNAMLSNLGIGYSEYYPFYARQQSSYTSIIEFSGENFMYHLAWLLATKKFGKPFMDYPKTYEEYLRVSEAMQVGFEQLIDAVLDMQSQKQEASAA